MLSEGVSASIAGRYGNPAANVFATIAWPQLNSYWQSVPNLLGWTLRPQEAERCRVGELIRHLAGENLAVLYGELLHRCTSLEVKVDQHDREGVGAGYVLRRIQHPF